MFNWGKSSKELKETIVNNENTITQLRDEKIKAQIDLSRAQAGFNAQKEVDRANHQVATAQLERRIQELESDFDDAVEHAVTEKINQLDKEGQQNRINTKKELRAEFGAELDTAKKAVASLTTENAKNKGNYDGALLVIKSLETQVYQVNELNKTLVKALPQVSASITTPNPSVIVGSGNKS